MAFHYFHTKYPLVILKVRKKILRAFHFHKYGHQMIKFHADSDVIYGHVHKPKIENLGTLISVNDLYYMNCEHPDFYLFFQHFLAYYSLP